MIEIVWRQSSAVDHQEMADLVYTYDGAIMFDGEREIGWFRALYVDAGRALNQGIALEDVCRAHSQKVYKYMHALYVDCEGPLSFSPKELSSEVAQTIGITPIGLNLLIVDEIALKPQYRGAGVALKVIRHLMERLGHDAGVTVINPSPMQFERLDDQKREMLALDTYSKSRDVAVQHLSQYASSLGFKRLPGTSLLLFGNDAPLPDLD